MKEKILNLRNLGYTYNQIVDELGCAKSLVSYYCGENQKLKSHNRLKKYRSGVKSVIEYRAKNIKICILCKKITKNPKYCSNKCCSLHQTKIKKCKYCETILKLKYRVCCDNCRYIKSVINAKQSFKRFENISLNDLKNKYSTTQYHAKIRMWARTVYKNHHHGQDIKCKICGYGLFYEVCHIKPIADFTLNSKVSEINSLDNLISLCPNHHWELDNKVITLDSGTLESNQINVAYETS